MFALLTFIILSLDWNEIAANNETVSSNECPTFICTDGLETSLGHVCDGLAHCLDSSDEIATLCKHIVCPPNKYKCAYGACINKSGRCDGIQDCIDGSDEQRCDSKSDEICPDYEFQCSTNEMECIPLADICDGHADCSDGSDEIETVCHEYTCPENTYQCSYGGCVHQEVVCDGVKDCFDGSDEDVALCAANNCQGDKCAKYECRTEEFRCKNSAQCISKEKMCDGIRQCRDGSDEEPQLCMSRECVQGFFRCAYGGCIPEKLKCNSRPDCYDWSDEEESTCGLSLPKGACRLPGPKPSTHYTVRGCRHCRPGNIVPRLTRLDYTCDIEGSLEGSTSIYCRNNRWFPQVPVCPQGDSLYTITCPPIKTAFGATMRCESKWGPHKGWVNCDSALPVGTRVTLECPDFYERRSGSSSIVCLHDGTWTQQPLTCSPICGVMPPSVGALIVNGWEADPKDSLPWHATLYALEDGKWKFFCGGTLIAERIVLTAAHCLWKTDPDILRIAVGTFSSDLNMAGNLAQVFDVKSIELQESYQDHDGNYGSDIALIILKKPVKINSYVMPACINWNSDVTLTDAQRHGGTGLVAGMGLTEDGTYSSNLKLVSLKVVSDQMCREKQKGDFRKYVTYTSFCAGWTNGTSVCNGDSGGGLLLKTNASTWEVHGIVSISPRKLGTSTCDPNYYTIFTKVSPYNAWIRDIVESIPVVGPYDAHWQPNTDDIIL